MSKIHNLLQKISEKLSFNLFDYCDQIVLYLSSGESLPDALNPADENMYISMLSGENAHFARQKLIEHNLRLVVYIARKFESSNTDVEDLISIGSIGLIKAINSYQSDKNIKIATYASKCIENEILMYLRKVSKQKQEVSIDEPLSIDGDGNELVLGDVIATDDDDPAGDFASNLNKKILWSVLGKLPKREKEIILMRFGLGGGVEKTQKEVADTLGISQSYISRLEKKIASRIKKELSSRI